MTLNLAVLHCKITTVILHQIHSSKLCFYSPRHNLQGKYSILTLNIQVYCTFMVILQ